VGFIMTAEGHLLFSIACAVFAKNAELTPVLAQGDWWHIVPSAVLTCLLPDIDHPKSFLGQRLKWISKPIARAFGHRGFTHSLVFAFVVPLLCVLIGRRWFRAGLIRCWLFLTVSLLSHSLLDSVTTGGKGVGWLWPWSDERFFAPWQVIKVAPFALSRYSTPYGHQVIISELMWVWLPGMVLMGMLWWRRR
jgi:membrane-bound metal-dependent hydrolase YbcI (DUF457 family)